MVLCVLEIVSEEKKIVPDLQLQDYIFISISWRLFQSGGGTVCFERFTMIMTRESNRIHKSIWYVMIQPFLNIIGALAGVTLK